jgi:hypothetical protein
MVFGSHLLLFYFLPVTLLVYYELPRGKHLVLTLLSYVFYGWANPLFVVKPIRTNELVSQERPSAGLPACGGV